MIGSFRTAANEWARNRRIGEQRRSVCGRARVFDAIIGQHRYFGDADVVSLCSDRCSLKARTLSVRAQSIPADTMVSSVFIFRLKRQIDDLMEIAFQRYQINCSAVELSTMSTMDRMGDYYPANATAHPFVGHTMAQCTKAQISTIIST